MAVVHKLSAGFVALFLIIACSRKSTAATTTTDTSGQNPFQVCPAVSTACFDDALCLECVTGSLPINETECTRIYPSLSQFITVDVTPINSTSASDTILAAEECEELGVLICCTLDLQAANNCSSSQLTLEFWECGLEYKGCSVADLPCYANITDVIDSSTALGGNTPAPATSSGGVGEDRGVTPSPVADVDDTLVSDTSGAVAANGMLPFPMATRGVLTALFVGQMLRSLLGLLFIR